MSSIPAVIPDTLELFNCFVCDENFQEARNLKEHAKNEHMIELQLSKLLDGNEETPFVRFVKSINMGDDYVSKRIKLYPENWDQIEERINIRMMAQKKLEICSKHIEQNMKENELKNIRKHKISYEWAEI